MNRILIITLLLCLLAPKCLRAQETSTTERTQDSGTIDQLKQSIEQNNLELKALRHEQQADLHDMKAENTVAGPSVEFSPLYQKGIRGLAESELIVSEEFDFPTRYVDRSKQTRLQGDVLNRQYEAKRQEILLQGELLVLDIIRLNKIAAQQNERITECNTILTLLNNQLKDGNTTALDVSKATLEHVDAQHALERTLNERSTLLNQLTTLNGGQAIDVELTLFPEQRPIADIETFIQHSLQNNSQIQIALAQLKASEHNVKTTRREWLPSLSVGYRLNTAVGENSLNGVVVGASFPIFSQLNRKKAANERLTNAQINLQMEKENTTQQLRSLHNQLCSIERMLQLDDLNALNHLHSLLDKALKEKQITLFEYLTEHSTIHERIINNIELQCEQAKLQSVLHSTFLQP